LASRSRPRPRRGGPPGGARRPQDRYGRRAKREGFAARSVYKLQEIDRRVGLLRPGARVLDLGAAPGSWSQFIAEKVGPQGVVLAVDEKEAGVDLPPWVRWQQSDVLSLTPGELGGPSSFEVVLSDMAPATTGHRSLDQARSFRLFEAALALAVGTLVPGGRFCAKIFQSGDFPEAQRQVRDAFDKARVLRPQAIRTESYEVYLVGLGFRGAPDPG